jgi:hypothetical protein
LKIALTEQAGGDANNNLVILLDRYST